MSIKFDDEPQTIKFDEEPTQDIKFDVTILESKKEKPVFITYRSQGIIMDRIVDKIMEQYVRADIYAEGTSDYGSPILGNFKP